MTDAFSPAPLTRARRTASALGLAMLVACLPAAAQDNAAPKTTPENIAKLFDEICYSSMPDFAPVATRAKSENWTAITGNALQAYRPSAETDYIRAWSFKHHGQTIRIALSSSPVDPPMAQILPAFGKGRAYACSLILPGAHAQDAMAAAMKQIVGRAPDETYPEPPWTVDFWSGITDDIAALLYHYRPKSGRRGGLYSFVVLKK